MVRSANCSLFYRSMYNVNLIIFFVNIILKWNFFVHCRILYCSTSSQYCKEFLRLVSFGRIRSRRSRRQRIYRAACVGEADASVAGDQTAGPELDISPNAGLGIWYQRGPQSENASYAGLSTGCFQRNACNCSHSNSSVAAVTAVGSSTNSRTEHTMSETSCSQLLRPGPGVANRKLQVAIELQPMLQTFALKSNMSRRASSHTLSFPI